ncbi:hypothetical protein [Acidovorax sp. SRB_24]|uniref:hypothetical protein n=1 Tax=Acidovorax sp. SRB_24 TaxID=1962700 RepID=UPI00145E3041|nr:hypothetical protein [Acidovorax sp. SRB_24]NMM77559.1 hypothetical protein [Acidovorax sp. SRB_24]
MSAPMHPTAQQLADSAGVSRRLIFQAAAVHRYGCLELVKAAHSGLLAMKHCETLAKALTRDAQREFLAELSTMTPRQRYDLLAIIKGDLTYRNRTAHETAKGALHG